MSMAVPRAVIDTSALVPARLHRGLQQAAEIGAFIAIWSPWIIAELNRVLTWRWIKHPPAGRAAGDISDANEQQCAEMAKIMMELLVPCFELVNPQPPYPPTWPELTDVWDQPIWATAKLAKAHYVVSENTRDYPPVQPDGRHVHDDIEYLSGDAFLAVLTGGANHDAAE